jgi:hypothetical protein
MIQEKAVFLKLVLLTEAGILTPELSKILLSRGQLLLGNAIALLLLEIRERCCRSFAVPRRMV